MAKFRLLHQLLLDQQLIQADQVVRPISISKRDLERVHARRYHEDFSRDRLSRADQRRIGLPATTPLIQRTWLAVGGTLKTARLALSHGLACHLAGGTHHAHRDFGSAKHACLGRQTASFASREDARQLARAGGGRRRLIRGG